MVSLAGPASSPVTSSVWVAASSWTVGRVRSSSRSSVGRVQRKAFGPVVRFCLRGQNEKDTEFLRVIIVAGRAPPDQGLGRDRQSSPPGGIPSGDEEGTQGFARRQR